MAPKEDELDRHESTAVDDILLSEKHLHQRDDEDAGVRIDAARLLDGLFDFLKPRVCEGKGKGTGSDDRVKQRDQ